MTDIVDPVGAVTAFLQRGGNVLVLLLVATFLMWTVILERYLYFWFEHGRVVKKALDTWHSRSDHHSWYAHKVREQLISEVRQRSEASLGLMRALVAVVPLMGLLGTVTGMIEVFESMAALGNVNARALASGVSKATIPTMAGMVAAITGLYFATQLGNRVTREVARVGDNMELMDRSS